jgi:hypothetical protein
MRDEDDRPLTEEEQALAREGESLIAAAMADVHAPQSLREAIERERQRAASQARPRFWRRYRWGLAAAGTAAAVLAVVAIALETGGSDTEPSLNGVYAAAGLDPTEAAPRPVGGAPPVLAAQVGNLAFPDWRDSFGWKAVGRRVDEVSGRDITTVFYRNPEGIRLGYAVVAGPALGGDPPGREITRNGKTYNLARNGDRTIVTWTQQGHTCAIVAPSALPGEPLVDLAASRNV